MQSIRSGAMGGIPGPCTLKWLLVSPPNKNCTSPSEDCTPRKLTGSGLLKYESRPKTPKLVITARIFVILIDLHQISLNFWDEDLFLGLHLRIRGKSPNFETITRICGNFFTEDLFFCSSPFSFDPHWNKFLVPPCPSWIHINKLLVPPKFFLPSPPVTLSWRRAYSL